MLKTYVLTLAAAALLIPAASAQTDPHAGHDHSKHAQQPYNGPLSAAPNVEHIFTEAPDDHVIGHAAAPTTIIAYASVTCPHCSQWFIEEWPTFKKQQIDTGKARFIMREFPTSPQHLAMYGFLIANCGPEPDYFDNLVHQMQIQKEIFAKVEAGKGKEAYDALAARSGLKNDAAINACFNNPANPAKINRAVDRARAGGVQSVPTFFVDGALLSEEASAANLDKIITAKRQGGVSALPKAPRKTSK